MRQQLKTQRLQRSAAAGSEALGQALAGVTDVGLATPALYMHVHGCKHVQRTLHH
jgi:hypothetical protein